METRTLDAKLKDMENALNIIWAMVADAELNRSGRLSKDERFVIMMHCQISLGRDDGWLSYCRTGKG